LASVESELAGDEPQLAVLGRGPLFTGQRTSMFTSIKCAALERPRIGPHFGGQVDSEFEGRPA
jgi:hypothetical protein